jgi:hypothetical protein
VTALSTVRSELFDALESVAEAQVYRRRLVDYQYPALIVGWPQEMDVRPSMGGARDFVIDVFVGVEVTDDESCDDQLSDLLELAVAALLVNDAWDVQPATDFGEAVTQDARTIIWCRLPVSVLA